jgi:hypothetical protein
MTIRDLITKLLNLNLDKEIDIRVLTANSKTRLYNASEYEIDDISKNSDEKYFIVVGESSY